MGILVNTVLLRILLCIENQEDISEGASLRLNDLCKMLHDLENLFMDGEEVRNPKQCMMTAADILIYMIVLCGSACSSLV